MKKTLKGLSAILMTSVLAVSASAATVGTMTALAADPPTYSVTIDSTPKDTATHTYKAYQILAGDVTTTTSPASQIVSNATKGSNISDLDTFITALKAKSSFSSCNDLKDVLTVLNGKATDSTAAMEFAEVAKAQITGDPAGTGTTSISDLAGGYYLIVEDDSSPLSPTNSAYSRPMLTVVGPADDTAKKDVPSLGKRIGTTYANGIEANTASIGDTIPFVLQSAVPDMTGYNKYYFVINDDMCEGLTFDSTSTVTVKIGDTTLERKTDSPTAPTWFDVQTGDAADGHTLQIVFNNFIQYAAQKGDIITVTYSATLNENADRTVIGNENTVDLTFSNNPNTTYSGGTTEKPNEPKDNEPVGETPVSKTKTYTTGIKLVKVDADTKAALAGAEFEIKGAGVNSEVKLFASEVFTENASGAYYKLKDGTYTKIAPTPATSDKYDSTTTKYSLTSTALTGTADGTGENKTITAKVSADGTLIFEGLGAGTYTITETKAPTGGYNKLTTPINVTITASDVSLTGITWNVSPADATKANGISVLTIENNKGVTLPGTGGVGTTIFYIIGGLMISGALVLLIVKKRMSIKEK